MTFPTPIQEKLESYELALETNSESSQRAGAATGSYQPQSLTEFLAWGEDGCFVVATTGVVELEYAAIQKTVGVFDAPCRGTIQLTGPDRLECVGRLTTQNIVEMQPGDVRLAFVTSRTGKIIADAIVRVLSDKVLLDIDINAVQQVCDHIKAYVVMEDVEIENCTESTHWLWCFGPEAKDITIEDVLLHPLPKEIVGIDGVAIMVAPENVESVWSSLQDSGCKPIGWYALNMARVEQAAPFFMIDFDTNNLPHETSLIASRVRFDKGCYLGQEIIARMDSLGQPKQKIVQLNIKTDSLPIAGAQLWLDETTSGTPVGIVTSSAISPMRGSVPAVIAMVSKKCNAKDSSIFTHVGTEVVEAVVQLI
jgi:folate-binding protein YgfZ